MDDPSARDTTPPNKTAPAVGTPTTGPSRRSIVAVDAKPATALTLGEIREDLQRDGRRYDIAVLRGGERIVLPVMVELISID